MRFINAKKSWYWFYFLFYPQRCLFEIRKLQLLGVLYVEHNLHRRKDYYTHPFSSKLKRLYVSFVKFWNKCRAFDCKLVVRELFDNHFWQNCRAREGWGSNIFIPINVFSVLLKFFFANWVAKRLARKKRLILACKGFHNEIYM